jgi:hypothetical protein
MTHAKHKTQNNFQPTRFNCNTKQNYIAFLIFQNKFIYKNTRIQAQNIENKTQTPCVMKSCINTKKNLQNITHYALESQITKSELKPFTNNLYPKHKMFRITFSFKPISTPIT